MRKTLQSWESGQSSGRRFENVSANLNGIFMVPTANEILFSKTFPGQNYTRFKGNKLRHVQKCIYLVNVWSIIDIFMVQHPFHPF